MKVECFDTNDEYFEFLNKLKKMKTKFQIIKVEVGNQIKIQYEKVKVIKNGKRKKK